jgi:hypothetical protein
MKRNCEGEMIHLYKSEDTLGCLGTWPPATIGYCGGGHKESGRTRREDGSGWKGRKSEE